MPGRDALLPWRTAIKNVEFPLKLQHGLSARERGDRARELLAVVGLEGFESYYPYALSAGMRQRVAIARTFATSSTVLLMDEPFSALDAQTKVHVQDIFLSMWEREQRTVLLITHDVVEAVALADKVVVFSAAPGTVRSTYEVDVPRPRSVQHLIFEDPVFQDYLKTIWLTCGQRRRRLPDRRAGHRSREASDLARPVTGAAARASKNVQNSPPPTNPCRGGPWPSGVSSGWG
jgi:NitT/TauT family transport system ATP-binding protein